LGQPNAFSSKSFRVTGRHSTKRLDGKAPVRPQQHNPDRLKARTGWWCLRAEACSLFPTKRKPDQGARWRKQGLVVIKTRAQGAPRLTPLPPSPPTPPAAPLRLEGPPERRRTMAKRRSPTSSRSANGARPQRPNSGNAS
ncbi:unnamed protein product, partial [Ectocarpus sp. 12 AP-2014]